MFVFTYHYETLFDGIGWQSQFSRAWIDWNYLDCQIIGAYILHLNWVKLWFKHVFIARKSENSVLDQIKFLQIQDWTLVYLNHLMKYHPIPLCPVDTQQYQDSSSHSAFFYNLTLSKVSPVLFLSLCVALPLWTGRCLCLSLRGIQNTVWRRWSNLCPCEEWAHEPLGW